MLPNKRGIPLECYFTSFPVEGHSGKLTPLSEQKKPWLEADEKQNTFWAIQSLWQRSAIPDGSLSSLSYPHHWSTQITSCPSSHCAPTTQWSYAASILKMTCMTVLRKQELRACCFFILSPLLLILPVGTLNSQAYRPCCIVDSRFWPCFAT